MFYILFHTKREHLLSQKKVQKLNVRYGGTTLQKKYNTCRQILTKHANSHFHGKSKKVNSSIQQCYKKVNYILSCEVSKQRHLSFLRKVSLKKVQICGSCLLSKEFAAEKEQELLTPLGIAENGKVGGKKLG